MEKEFQKKNMEKIRALLFVDNALNKPIKTIIRKLGLYSLVYNFLDRFEMHDEISMRKIRKLINKDNPIILEIGAHIGQDTNRFLKTFKNLKIYSFEPDPRSIKQFKKNINSDNSKLIEAAISDKNGYVLLHQSSGNKRYSAGKEEISEWTASSTIKKPVKQSEFVKYIKNVKVKTTRLDDWIKKNKIEYIDLIWADVEGSEKELILGGLDTLNKKTRYFYTEFFNNEIYEGQPTLSEIKKMLPNFKIIGIFGNNALMINTEIKADR